MVKLILHFIREGMDFLMAEHNFSGRVAVVGKAES